MLMVPFENVKEFPSKSKRIRRGNLGDSIGKLKEIEHNLKKNRRKPFEIQRVSFGILGFCVKSAQTIEGCSWLRPWAVFLDFSDGTPIKFKRNAHQHSLRFSRKRDLLLKIRIIQKTNKTKAARVGGYRSKRIRRFLSGGFVFGYYFQICANLQKY